MPVKSHKVQLEARHSWKHSDFERDFKEKTGSSFSVFSSFLVLFEFSLLFRVFSVFSRVLGISKDISKKKRARVSWFSRVFSFFSIFFEFSRFSWSFLGFVEFSRFF